MQTDTSISKPGKHGEAKARIEGVSLFTGKKKTLLSPTGHRVKVPVLKKETASAVADVGNGKWQLMDMESFETYESEIPAEFRSKIQAGSEVEVQAVMGQRFVQRVK